MSLITSSKLGIIATGLQKIINHQLIGKDEKQEFEWGAKLIGRIDWDSEHYKEYPELAVLATKLRPDIFKTFREIPFEKIYQTLKSRGEKVRLSKEELIQTYKGFMLMATNSLYSSHPMGQI